MARSAGRAPSDCAAPALARVRGGGGDGGTGGRVRGLGHFRVRPRRRRRRDGTAVRPPAAAEDPSLGASPSSSSGCCCWGHAGVAGAAGGAGRGGAPAVGSVGRPAGKLGTWRWGVVCAGKGRPRAQHKRSLSADCSASHAGSHYSLLM